MSKKQLTQEQIEKIQSAFERVSKYVDLSKVDRKYGTMEGIQEQIDNGASTVFYFDADLEEPQFKIAVCNMSVG